MYLVIIFFTTLYFLTQSSIFGIVRDTMKVRLPDMGAGRPPEGKEVKESAKIHKLCEPIFRHLRELTDPNIQYIRDVAVDLNGRVLNMYGIEEVPRVPTPDQRLEAQGFCKKLIHDINQLFRDRPDLAERQPLQEIVEYVDQVLMPYINTISATEDVEVERRAKVLGDYESPHLSLRSVFTLLAEIKDDSIKMSVTLPIRHINTMLVWIDEGATHKGVDFRQALESGKNQLAKLIYRCITLDINDQKRLSLIKEQVDGVVSEYLLNMGAAEKQRQQDEYRRLVKVVVTTSKDRPRKSKGMYTPQPKGGRKK